jgi:hypothetical protein
MDSIECNRCSSLSDKYEGKQIKDIKELDSDFEEIAVDYKAWVATFQCKLCGQLWIEKFEQKGHGEIPVVYKVSQ